MKEQQKAFPVIYGENDYVRDGMTMRQYYKAKAMQAMISGWDDANYVGRIAEEAGKIADAMIKEDEKHS